MVEEERVVIREIRWRKADDGGFRSGSVNKEEKASRRRGKILFVLFPIFFSFFFNWPVREESLVCVGARWWLKEIGIWRG